MKVVNTLERIVVNMTGLDAEAMFEICWAVVELLLESGAVDRVWYMFLVLVMTPVPIWIFLNLRYDVQFTTSQRTSIWRQIQWCVCVTYFTYVHIWGLAPNFAGGFFNVMT